MKKKIINIKFIIIKAIQVHVTKIRAQNFVLHILKQCHFYKELIRYLL